MRTCMARGNPFGPAEPEKSTVGTPIGMQHRRAGGLTDENVQSGVMSHSPKAWRRRKTLPAEKKSPSIWVRIWPIAVSVRERMPKRVCLACRRMVVVTPAARRPAPGT
jgi:hypothetical protein